MAYSEKTTTFINEFFRLMTITQSKLKDTITMGYGYQQDCIKERNFGCAKDIQTDIDELQELVSDAAKYTEHIERSVNNMLDEHALNQSLSKLTESIRCKLTVAVEEVEGKLKEVGILPLTPEEIEKFRR